MPYSTFLWCYLKEKSITSSFLSNYGNICFCVKRYCFHFFAANVTFYIITTTHAPNEMCRSELYYYISGFKMEEAEL